MLTTRLAVLADLEDLVPRIEAFFAIESIPYDDDLVRAGLVRLLAEPDLGVVVLLEEGPRTVGYGVVTWGFDLEFGGRDAYLTDFFLDADARGRGLGRPALGEFERVAKEHGVRQLHLMVRPENHAALRLYLTSGYVRPPRLFFSKAL